LQGENNPNPSFTDWNNRLNGQRAKPLCLRPCRSKAENRIQSRLSGFGFFSNEPLITLQTDVFDLLNLSSVPLPRIQQFADNSHQDEYDDNGMQLEEKKKQKQDCNQGKGHHQDDPERVIFGVLVLDRGDIF
jgi:hypothetical protein